MKRKLPMVVKHKALTLSVLFCSTPLIRDSVPFVRLAVLLLVME